MQNRLNFFFEIDSDLNMTPFHIRLIFKSEVQIQIKSYWCRCDFLFSSPFFRKIYIYPSCYTQTTYMYELCMNLCKWFIYEHTCFMLSIGWSSWRQNRSKGGRLRRHQFVIKTNKMISINNNIDVVIVDIVCLCFHIVVAFCCYWMCHCFCHWLSM